MDLWACWRRPRTSRQYCICSCSRTRKVRLKVQVEEDRVFKDDLTGQLLNPELVKLARTKEMEYFDGKDVWNKDMGRLRSVGGTLANHR